MDNPQAHEQLLGEIANGEILWHYTDWAGCAGVLGLADKPAALWLTDYRYLNDELEVQWALDLFHHALNGKPADPVPPCERSWQGAQTTSYVACFCRTPDQLSQWRAYSLADPRFALAVRRKALEALGKEFGATVEAVTYTEIGDKKIDEIAEPVIAATQELRALPDSRSNAEPRFREVEGARAKRSYSRSNPRFIASENRLSSVPSRSVFGGTGSACAARSASFNHSALDTPSDSPEQAR